MKSWMVLGLILMVGCKVEVEAGGDDSLAREAREEDPPPLEEEPPVEEEEEEIPVTGCSPNCPSDLEDPEWAFLGVDIPDPAIACPIRNSNNLQLNDVEAMKILGDRVWLLVSGTPCTLERQNYLTTIKGAFVNPSTGVKTFWFTAKNLRWVASHTAVATICINGVYACRDIQAIVPE